VLISARRFVIHDIDSSTLNFVCYAFLIVDVIEHSSNMIIDDFPELLGTRKAAPEGAAS